jgi:hypothetical protein
MSAGYGKHIRWYVQNLKPDEPVLTAAVVADMVREFDLTTDQARRITNVNLKRLADGGMLVRVKKGVYGKTRQSLFGPVAPNRDEIIAALLMGDGDVPIGYEAGLSLLNRLGLTTLVPRNRTIATNRYRFKLPEDVRIEVKRPPVPVSATNVAYLQALEAVKVLSRTSVEAMQPEMTLFLMFEQLGLDRERLIWYAFRYADDKTLKMMVGITLGGLVEHEAA